MSQNGTTCPVLKVSHTSMHRSGGAGERHRAANPSWTDLLRQLIQQYHTYGYRLLWVLPRFRDRIITNRKTVYRVLKQKWWFVHQRAPPRVRGWVSLASQSNKRWAMDVTHIPCGQDGLAHLGA